MNIESVGNIKSTHWLIFKLHSVLINDNGASAHYFIHRSLSLVVMVVVVVKGTTDNWYGFRNLVSTQYKATIYLNLSFWNSWSIMWLGSRYVLVAKLPQNVCWIKP